MAIACEEYGAKFFANGAAPGGVLEHPGTIKDPGRVRESWQSTFGGSGNANKVAVLEEGMKYTPIGISPEQAQFLETRKFQINEIARIFRVPPHMVSDLETGLLSPPQKHPAITASTRTDVSACTWKRRTAPGVHPRTPMTRGPSPSSAHRTLQSPMPSGMWCIRS